MKYRTILLPVLLLMIWSGLFRVPSQVRPAMPDCHPMAELDQHIQKRFGTMERFGVRRIVTTPYHLQYFKPENEAEKKTLAQLEQDQWTVAFYLAGRQVLEEKPDEMMWQLWEKQSGNFYLRKPINNPVLLTRDAKLEHLPTTRELWDETRRAMKMFSRKDQYEFRVGDWKIAARPIRASQEACLKCHVKQQLMADGTVKPLDPQLKIGAPLGVALYAYRPAK